MAKVYRHFKHKAVYTSSLKRKAYRYLLGPHLFPCYECALNNRCFNCLDVYDRNKNQTCHTERKDRKSYYFLETKL